jgi:hypothetical protein
MKRIIGIMVLGVMSVALAAQALEFPGQSPGNARVVREGDVIKMQNDVLSATWSLADKHLTWKSFESRINDAKVTDVTCLFVLDTSAGRIDSTSCVLESELAIQSLVPDPKARRNADRLPGKSIAATFFHAKTGVKVAWRAELRDGANALRSVVAVTAGSSPVTVDRITLFEGKLLESAVIGAVQSSPVAGKGIFLGYEHPLAGNSVDNEKVSSAHKSNRKLAPGETCYGSVVLGVYPEGQLRRAFLCYLEQERIRPYAPWLHYNSWYDVAHTDRNGGLFTEKDVLGVIDVWGREFVQKRGVPLKSFLLDDGWDNHDSVWEFHLANWPRGLTEVGKAAATYNSHISMWLSPWGGYSYKQKRLAAGRKEEMEIKAGSFSLSGPNYYRRFHDQCLKMVTGNGVNGFKFDGIGSGNEGVGAGDKAADFDAAIRLFADLRAAQPDMYINLTTGTWPSPFWLLLADSIWRSGGDHSTSTGEGSLRQRWMTYRDGITYEKVVKAGPLYPLNSLMVHGIINADYAGYLKGDPKGDPKNELRSEIRSFFANGTQLQELYISHRLMTQTNWDELAESAKWAQAHADVLVDSHWVGGNPMKSEVYGWAAWTPKRAVLTLRNPSGKPASITLDAGQVFELPEGAPKTYKLKSPYKDQRVQEADMTAGMPLTLELMPFEVLVFDAAPMDAKGKE